MTAHRSPAERADAGPPRDRPIETYPLPPGPNGYPLVGSTLDVVRDPLGFYDRLATYGDVVRYETVIDTFTALLHPDHVERVLLEEPDRFEQYDFEAFGLGIDPEGLVDVDGEQWQRQRTLVQPAFTVDRVRSHADSMVDYATRTAAEWDDGQELALNEEFSALTLQILTRSLFDLDIDPRETDEVIALAARAFNEQLDPRNLTTFLPVWVPTPANRRFKRTYRAYRDRMDELIDQRRRSDEEADDLLTTLLHAEGPEGYTLSETEIRDNMMTFMFAGHDTTSLGLTYTFLLLAQHDDALARLHREHERVLGDERPTTEHLPELEFTERVITEAMRLYPPVYMLFRRATEPVVVDGYRIPEGTVVTLPQFWLHRDERFYDDPDGFDPDRWIESTEELPDYAYFPFGGGPRHCIGMRFARLEMKLVVAVLARAFDFELLSDPDPDLSPGVTLRPDDDVRVRVRERSA